MSAINVDEIRQYNLDLKAYQNKAATAKAELEFTNKELTRLCAELSKELGENVTIENIGDVYNRHVEKIVNTLQSGREILTRIAAEEASAQNNQLVNQPVVQQQNQQYVQQQQYFGQQQQYVQQPVFNGGQQPVFNSGGQQSYVENNSNQLFGAQQFNGFAQMPNNANGKTVLSPVSAIPTMGNSIEI